MEGGEGYHLPAGRWMLTVFSDLMCDTATVARPPAVNRLSAACLLFFHLVTFHRFSSAVLSMAASFHDILGEGKLITFSANISWLSNTEPLSFHISVMEATSCLWKHSDLMYLYTPAIY